MRRMHGQRELPQSIAQRVLARVQKEVIEPFMEVINTRKSVNVILWFGNCGIRKVFEILMLDDLTTAASDGAVVHPSLPV